MRRWVITTIITILVGSPLWAASMTSLKDYKSAFAQAVNNASVPDSEVVVYLNDGIYQVADDLRCIQKKDTVVCTEGNADYALNSDALLNAVESVELMNGGTRQALLRVGQEEVGKVGAVSGCPQTWYVWGTVLTVYPEGTAEACSLVVKYAAQPTYLSDDTDTVQIPKTYSWLAVHYAKYKYLDAVGRDADAGATLNSYEQAVAMKRFLIEPNTAGSQTGVQGGSQ